MARKLGRLALPLVFWLAVWALAARLAAAESVLGGELLLPAPRTVLSALLTLAGTAAFWQTALLSLARMALGLVLGCALGALLAVLTARSRGWDALFSPAVKVVRAAPVASFILLVLLWVERGWVSVVIAALMVLPVLWASVRQGIEGTDPKLLELARCYGFDRWKTLRLVWLPSIKPAFTAGLATAMGLAWKAGVAAEVLCQPKRAIGTEIYRSKWTLDTPGLFAWTLVVVLLSLAMESLVKRLLKRGSNP